ncbi:uncharacterized protein LOC133996941 [Scomber scombrus]|uniref:uncharacterized protein LOC133996941 n=1 Tax=Scomber scombrus TaxID=13677 RepID=UPI002DD95EC3|nr:uncharacterized protein LOC133996941 [Scomber scombrus]
MEKSPVKSCMPAVQQFNECNFKLSNGKIGADYLAWVSDFVSTYRHKSFTLENPAGATLRIGGLDDTIYRDAHARVNGWGKFYLPGPVHMQVIGVVEVTSCPCDQLVLMTCEDKKVYAYNGEELHLVASSVKQLDKEIEYPASKIYYKGEAFKDMTEEDWDKVRAGPVGRKLDQEHHKRVTLKKSKFLENLKTARQNRGVVR